MSDYNEQEKQMLIESMAKLIEHIHDSKVHQTEIFNSLTTNDLLKILSNIEDKNLKLRKTSCRFLCELLYDNTHVQDLFCELTGVLPIDGKVCVNKIPESFNPHMKFIPDILEIVKTTPIPVNANGKAPICWYFSSRIDYNVPFKVQYFFPQEQDNFDSCEFIDPQETIFGFVINSPLKQKRIDKDAKSSMIQDSSKYSIEKESYKSQHNNNNNQASLNSSRVSPIKKRDAQIGSSSNNNSSSFIKKIQFNSSSSRQDRSFSDKKEVQKAIQSTLGNNNTNNVQDSLDQSYQQNYQNSQSKNGGTISQEQSVTKVTQPNSASGKDNISSFQNNTLPGEISLNDSIEFVNMAKAYSPYSPRYELAIRQKHNQNTNKYSLLKRRKTAEGISEKSLKFKNTTNTTTSTNQPKQKQISIAMAGSNSFRQSYTQQKKRESSNSMSKNPQVSQSMVHGVQIKKFQLQTDNSQFQNTSNQNSSFDNLQSPINTQSSLQSQQFPIQYDVNRKLEQKYESTKAGYSLKDKRYSQQDQYSKQIITEKRNAVNASAQQPVSKNNPYNLLSKSTYEHPINENNSGLFPNQTPKFTNLEHKNYLSSKNNNGFNQSHHVYSNNLSVNSPQLMNASNTPQSQQIQFFNTPTNNQNGTQKKVVSLHNKSQLVSKSLSINSNK